MSGGEGGGGGEEVEGTERGGWGEMGGKREDINTLNKSSGCYALRQALFLARSISRVGSIPDIPAPGHVAPAFIFALLLSCEKL